jgi:hypothetical protein
MKKTCASALAVFSLLLVLSAASATPLAPDYSKVGVKVGDTATYRSSFTTEIWNKTKLLVYGIVGTVVYLNYTNYNPDGSPTPTGQWTIDVLAGSFLLFGFLIAGNLTAGNPFYSGCPWAINGTSQMVVGGALRTVNHANYNGGGFNVYWDQATGLMTELHLSFMGWQNYTLLSTTAWAPDTVPSLLNMTTIALIEGVVIIVLAIALVVVASRRRKR